MIFTVLDIQFSKEQLRKLISLTDKNKDGKIDSKEFSRMLFAKDVAKQSGAVMEGEDIQIVDEASNESDTESDEDAQMKAEIKSGMRANRERVMSAKRGTAAANPEESKRNAKGRTAAIEEDEDIEDESIQEDQAEQAAQEIEESIAEESMPKPSASKSRGAAAAQPSKAKAVAPEF